MHRLDSVLFRILDKRGLYAFCRGGFALFRAWPDFRNRWIVAWYSGLRTYAIRPSLPLDKKPVGGTAGK